MTYPDKRTRNPAVTSDGPHTTNPVETPHALLHHAFGKNHDLPGIANIVLYAKELHNDRYKASQGTCFHFLSIHIHFYHAYGTFSDKTTTLAGLDQTPLQSTSMLTVQVLTRHSLSWELIVLV